MKTTLYILKHSSINIDFINSHDNNQKRFPQEGEILCFQFRFFTSIQLHLSKDALNNRMVSGFMNKWHLANLEYSIFEVANKWPPYAKMKREKKCVRRKLETNSMNSKFKICNPYAKVFRNRIWKIMPMQIANTQRDDVFVSNFQNYSPRCWAFFNYHRKTHCTSYSH